MGKIVWKDELRFCIAMCLLKSEISKVNKYKYEYSQTMTRQFIAHDFYFSLMLFLFQNSGLNTSLICHV